MVNATLIISKKGKSNKEILGFVDRQLEDLVRSGIHIDFQIALPADKKHYDEQGIKQFPFLQIGDTRIAKTPGIIRHLTQTIKRQKIKREERTPGDDMHDFMMDSLGNPDVDARGNVKDDDSDDDPDGMGDIQAKLNAALEQRNAPQGEARTPAPSVKAPRRPTRRDNVNVAKSKLDPDTSDVLSGLGGDGDARKDDDLMSRFFQNQETSM